jgi:phosphonate transport system substrate-binding protein
MSKKVLMIRMAMVFVIGLTATIMAASCQDRDKAQKISFEKVRQVEKRAGTEGKNLRAALGILISPGETYGYYYQAFDYIARRASLSLKMVQDGSYVEVLERLKLGKVDVASLGSLPYVIGHDDFGLELLAAPMVNGKTVNHSLIIVHADSPATSLEDLRGQIFGFCDPLSFSGKLVPAYMLAQIDETPGAFFEDYSYTQSHDKTIEAVARKLIDAGAVDGLVWEGYNRLHPGISSKTKVIKKSDPYGIPPVVVRPGLEPRLKRKIKEILLDMHNNEEGKAILQGLMVDRFVEIDDSAYDSIRRVKAFLTERK